MHEIIFDISESPEGGYEARAVGHSIFTQAESKSELHASLKDAVNCHFEDAERPKVIRLLYTTVELLGS